MECKTALNHRSAELKAGHVDPKCPNCGRPMTLINKPLREEAQHTFECKSCGVSYMTDDHTPITGAQDRSKHDGRKP